MGDQLEPLRDKMEEALDDRLSNFKDYPLVTYAEVCAKVAETHYAGLILGTLFGKMQEGAVTKAAQRTLEREQ